jgi:hypothetical protein
MPEASAHVEKAEHNERFATAVRGLSSEFLDWVATAYFYSALHYLEAYLAANPAEKHPSTARYDTRPFSAQDIDANLIPRFDSFKKEALSLLGSWL